MAPPNPSSKYESSELEDDKQEKPQGDEEDADEAAVEAEVEEADDESSSEEEDADEAAVEAEVEEADDESSEEEEEEEEDSEADDVAVEAADVEEADDESSEEEEEEVADDAEDNAVEEHHQQKEVVPAQIQSSNEEDESTVAPKNTTSASLKRPVSDDTLVETNGQPQKLRKITFPFNKRRWTHEHEIALLQGMIENNVKPSCYPAEFHDLMQKKLGISFARKSMTNKILEMKNSHMKSLKKGKTKFYDDHQTRRFELFQKILGEDDNTKDNNNSKLKHHLEVHLRHLKRMTKQTNKLLQRL